MSFKDILGQDSAIGFLRRSIENNRVANAYIFYGPDGAGKKLTALNFAKALNCESLEKPCDICSSCKKVDNNNHPDIFLAKPDEDARAVKAAGIDAIISNASLKPYEAKKKVYIIEDAGNIADHASTILLKTLEEPSSDLIIILIAEHISQLLPTIRSRAQAVKFFSLGAESIEKILINKYDSDPAQAAVAARIASGSMSEAVRLRDGKFMSRRSMILDALVAGNFSGLDFDKEKKSDLKLVLNIMLSWYRDIMAIKACGPDIINIDKKDLIARQADKMSFDKINQVIREILLTNRYLDQSVNQKLAMTALAMTL